MRPPGGPGLRPAWAPDGRRIAFHSDRTGDFEVFSLAIDGSDFPGLQIPGSTEPVTTDLWVVNADGTCPTRITDTGAAANASYRPVRGRGADV